MLLVRSENGQRILKRDFQYSDKIFTSYASATDGLFIRGSYAPIVRVAHVGHLGFHSPLPTPQGIPVVKCSSCVALSKVFDVKKVWKVVHCYRICTKSSSEMKMRIVQVRLATCPKPNARQNFTLT